ncbi:MAG TPA: hypothetical protein VE571_09350, partial [Solirubrobacteraceae bacterium]|nr:hypothetical protein [Solirubrobacteraceae bacterium]
SGHELTAEAIAGTVGELGERARRAIHEPEVELHAVYELRYRGQSFELPISASIEANPEQLRDGFEREHEDRYGYRDEEQELELVTIRVTATVPGADVTLAPSGGEDDADRGSREATIGGEQVELDLLRGSPPPGAEIKGPAAIDLPEATLIVPAEWSGEVDDTGTIHLWRDT